MGRVLLQGGCVLSLDKHVGNLRDADVLIDGDRVAEVGRGLKVRDAEVIEVTDAIVMPGFVDTHRHAWKTLLRNAGGADPGPGRAIAEAYGPHLAPDDVYAATLVGLLGAIETGITTVVDWADIPPGERFREASLQAHADAGLRTVFIHAVPDWARDAVDADAALRRLAADADALVGPAVSVGFGPADPTVGAIDRVGREWSLARDLGLRIHTHVGTDRSGRGIVAELAGRGLLGDDVTLVHGTHLADDDLDAIASHGAGVSLAPTNEMTAGLGPPPLQRLIDRDIRPGLGVDDEVVTPGDLFAQMRATQSVQHATVFDRKLAGKAGLPHLLSTREVIRYATVDGARVAGLTEVTGSLRPGKQADLVVLRTDRPNIAPVNDPIGAVVWGMDASNVSWVFVGGRPLLRDGVLEADVARARTLALTARDRVATAVGDLVETGDGGPR